MGKHSGKDSEALQGPHGPGPHPTPEESKRAAEDFDYMIARSEERAEGKRK